MKKTYWTVKAASIGSNNSVTLYFNNYTSAKAESLKNYRDKPVKHTVNADNYNNLKKVVDFID